MQSTKEHLILVRCSDGRIAVPDEFANKYWVHPISMPGGVIAPELSSITNDGGKKTLEVLIWNIETMIGLKNPTRVVFLPHSFCAAAQAVGLNKEALMEANLKFSLDFQRRYPGIRFTVVFDQHSECGNYREEPLFKDSTFEEVAT